MKYENLEVLFRQDLGYLSYALVNCEHTAVYRCCNYYPILSTFASSSVCKHARVPEKEKENISVLPLKTGARKSFQIASRAMRSSSCFLIHSFPLLNCAFCSVSCLDNSKTRRPSSESVKNIQRALC